MKIFSQPQFADVVSLLNKCNLPTSDITPEKLVLFFGVGEPDLDGVIGLEVHEGCGLIRSLAVDEDCRNQGIAKNLLSIIEAKAREKEIHSLFLLTTTAPSYFKKHGYSEVSRDDIPEAIKKTSEFSSVCPKSAIVMEKSI